MTMTLIQTVTVGAGGASSIDFTSIPGTATDLLVVCSLRNTTNESGIRLRFNTDTGSNYPYRMLYGNGASATSETGTTTGIATYSAAYLSATANTYGNISFYIPNYAGSTNKSVSVDGVSENNATTAYQALTAGLWSNTAAITTVKVTAWSGTWAENSTASLYSVTKGSGGASVS